MEAKQIKDLMEAYASVYMQPEQEVLDEAGMDMFATPAFKKAKADAATKVYTKPAKPLPGYGNAPRGASGPHAADAAVGTQSLIKPYNARSVVPRFPGLTLPEPDNSTPKVNIPKFPSPKGETERSKLPVTERPKPPAAVKPPKTPKVEPKVNPTKAPEKTPNPLMVDMPKGPGSMAAPEKPLAQTTTPRTPISPGSFGGGVGTRPTGMSAGTSTVKGLDRPVTSGLTTKSQDETQKKDRERSALSKRVAGYKSGGPSAGVREEVETDLFDYLLEYLVAEGYADTNKAALVIMANMSEEWKQNILEKSKDDLGDLEHPTYRDARIRNTPEGKPLPSLYKGDKPGIDKITGLPVKGV